MNVEEGKYRVTEQLQNKSSVLDWPGLALPGQAKAELLF